MQKHRMKKMDNAEKLSQKYRGERGEPQYFVVMTVKKEKKLQIMSLPAGKLIVEYSV